MILLGFFPGDPSTNESKKNHHPPSVRRGLDQQIPRNARLRSAEKRQAKEPSTQQHTNHQLISHLPTDRLTA